MFNSSETTKWKWAYRTVAWATHQPILYTVAALGNGKILEFGAGYYSTPMLMHIVNEKNGNLYSFESDEFFVKKFEQDTNFQISHVPDWQIFFESSFFKTISEQHWDLIFVDQAPFEARYETIKRLNNNCDYLLLHDCGYFFKNNIFKAEDYFKNHQVWYPPKRVSYAGPPTLVASNFKPCKIEVEKCC